MAALSIFEFTQRPSAQLLHKRGDPNDPRFGEMVATDPQDYPAADLVILGCPQDIGVERNKGRSGASQGPAEIRRCFYRLAAPDNLAIQLFDLGNTLIYPALEETHQLHRQIVEQVLRDGKKLVVLGGGNDISYPDCAALATVFEDVLAFNIDAHFDVRADIPGNSGTPYRQLLEEAYLSPTKFFEMGSLPFSNSSVYRRYLENKGVAIHSLEMLQDCGVEASFKAILEQQTASAIFWGFDLDAVRAADAPGVSAPNPLGLTAQELCQLARIAGCDSRTRLVEFSEVNPRFDVDSRTSRLVAAAIYYYLTALNEHFGNERS